MRTEEMKKKHPERTKKMWTEKKERGRRIEIRVIQVGLINIRSIRKRVQVRESISEYTFIRG